MGALARALKAKFKTPREALRALGLDESLLDVEKMAFDAKRRGRDGNVLSDLAGEPGGHKHWDMGPHADGDPDLGEQEEPEEMPDEEARELRRRQMRQLGGELMKDHGWSSDEVKSMFMHREFPTNALAGGLGGRLSEDDVDWTMKELEGIGTGGNVAYGPKVKDKRMAKDARLAQDSFDRMFPDAQRLTGSDMSHRYGDQLAMDAAAGDDGSFDLFFPDAKRIGIAG
jgi:hypothetical protein